MPGKNFEILDAADVKRQAYLEMRKKELLETTANLPPEMIAEVAALRLQAEVDLNRKKARFFTTDDPRARSLLGQARYTETVGMIIKRAIKDFEPTLDAIDKKVWADLPKT